MTETVALRVRIVDWYECAVNGVHELPLLRVDGAEFVVKHNLASDAGVVRFVLEAGTTVEEVPLEMRTGLVCDVRVYRVTETTETTPQGPLRVALPSLRFELPVDPVSGAMASPLDTAALLVRDRSQGAGRVRVDYEAAPGTPGAPVARGNPSWLVLDEMLAAPHPLCLGTDPSGCGRPVEVAWRSPTCAGRWACATHWPLLMAFAVTPVITAVWAREAWHTWRDTSEWERFAWACWTFACAADGAGRGETLPVDDRSALVASLYGELDHGVAAATWAAAVTNPAIGGVAALGIAMALQGEAPLQPVDVYWLDVPRLGLTLLDLGDRASIAGDFGTAIGRWRVAADRCDSAVAMYRLGEVARKSQDPGTAITWWTRGADLGHVGCMANLGALFSDLGDQQTANTWSRRAADRGSSDAMFNLGAAASNVRDYSAARYWFELAEKAGDTDAKKMLKRLPRR